MVDPWEAPQYGEAYIRSDYVDYECYRCGDFVGDIIKHTQHHYNLDQLMQSILALTKLIMPDAPPGQLLIEVPTTSTDGESGVSIALGGEGGRSGGASGGAGASVFGGRIAVGAGGRGNDIRIPECPICHSVGGGGHGGGCSNAGKPVSEWTTA